MFSGKWVATLQIAICLFLFSATPLAAVSSTAAHSNFKKIDRHALSAPGSAERSLKSLVSYLIKPAGSDMLKARSIYRWITANISYDTEAFFSGRYRNKKVTAEQVLRDRRGVCDAYATLFYDMGTLAGLEVKKISGIVKADGYTVSQVEQAENHAWNVVKINGRWHHVDATWGAGIVDRRARKFVPRFNDFYFLSDPRQLIFSHFPTDATWQQLKPAVSKKEFSNQVPLKPDFFTHGMRLESHRQAAFSVQDYAEVALQIPANINFIAKVADRGTVLEKHFYYWEREGDQAVIKVYFPKPGDYTLALFAKPANQTGQYPQVLEYHINAKKGSRQRFPVFQKAYFDNGLKLHSHTQGVIHSNGELKLSLQVPQSVFLLARLAQGNNQLSRDLVFLQREGGLYQIRSLFPKAGEYELQLFTKSNVNDAAVSALSYKVIAEQGAQSRYPVYFLKFEEHKAQLFSPISAQLQSGSKTFFKIKVPQAQRVAVKVGEQWFFLDKQGSVFSGNVPIETGTVKVLASFAKDTDQFSSLLRYSGM